MKEQKATVQFMKKWWLHVLIHSKLIIIDLYYKRESNFPTAQNLFSVLVAANKIMIFQFCHNVNQQKQIIKWN